MPRLLALSLFLLLFSFKTKAQTDSLTLFILKGCMRCIQTEDFLKKNEIPYRIYIGDEKSNYDQLNNLLKNAGFTSGQLTFPVVVYKGVTHYNISELEPFLKSLIDVKKKLN